MIHEALINLQEFISSRTNANSGLGNRVPSSIEYPYIQIMVDVGIEINHNTRNLALTNLRGTLKILGDEKNEFKTFEVLEKLLVNINQFDSQEGHRIEIGTVAIPEYVEDIYQISIPYTLRVQLQDIT